MKLSPALLLRGVSWTVATYAISQLFRLIGNIILTRLLAPELFGLIAIIHSVRLGIELMSDVGISQNVVYSKNSDKPDFYNTAWSMQLIRGVFLWIVSLIAAIPIARFYHTPELAYVLPIASLPFVFSGLNSTGRFLAQKQMRFVRINLFELAMDFISAFVNIAAALISPTIWALVWGGVVAAAARAFGSYFLVAGIRHEFRISKDYAWEILHFSKWIFVSSIAFFLSTNFDSLYLGKAATLSLLGVYSVARALSQQIVSLVTRLNAVFVFPIIASSNEKPRDDLRRQIILMRGLFLLVTVTGLALIAAGADILVSVFYDQRYQAAGWMLSVLILGSWFSILCVVNESILLGLGKPSYGAIANCTKFGWLVISVPLSFSKYGALGVVCVVAVSDAFRYVPVVIGQFRERFSFAMQDFLVTLAGISMIALFEWLRWMAGFGVSQI